MEIEKKFLVKELPEPLSKFEKKEMEQGYLCASPTVRVRKSDDICYLTCKSKSVLTESKARACEELEMPLTEEAYLHLREKTDGHMVRKTRYLVPLPDGHTGELDVFHGRLEGLYFIEVEFESEADADVFTPPAWFGDNVSDDKRYTNSFLSLCDSLDVFQK